MAGGAILGGMVNDKEGELGWGTWLKAFLHKEGLK